MLSLIYTTAFALMEQAISLYIEHIWVDPSKTEDAGIQEAGLMTAYFLIVVGITSIIVQGGLIGRLNKKFGEVRLTQMGIILILISMLGIPLIGGTKVFSFLVF